MHSVAIRFVQFGMQFVSAFTLWVSGVIFGDAKLMAAGWWMDLLIQRLTGDAISSANMFFTISGSEIRIFRFTTLFDFRCGRVHFRLFSVVNDVGLKAVSFVLLSDLATRKHRRVVLL